MAIQKPPDPLNRGYNDRSPRLLPHRLHGCDSLEPDSISSTKSSVLFCNHENAVEIIRQQIDATKTFDDTTQRIAVLARAADLFWPYQQQKARTAFLEALDLAILNFKDKGDNPKREGVRLSISTPDQRYVVIGAIAKRDYAWAAKLTEQMLKEESKQAEEEAAKDPQRDIGIAVKLLDTALLLLSSNVNTATNFARRSLSYPASLGLPIFLYKLAELDQAASDQFTGKLLRPIAISL